MNQIVEVLQDFEVIKDRHCCRDSKGIDVSIQQDGVIQEDQSREEKDQVGIVQCYIEVVEGIYGEEAYEQLNLGVDRGFLEIIQVVEC